MLKNLATKIMEILSSSQILLLSLLIPCILLLLFVYFNWFSSHSQNKKLNIPPSPPKLPIIGNFHQLGSFPNHNLQTLSKKYGSLMLLHLGSNPTLVVSSAEAAQEIMKNHDLSFCTRPHLTMSNILFYGSKGVAFSPYGEYWRRLKSIMVLNLLGTTRVKSCQKVRENEILDMIRVLGKSCGTTVDIGLMFATLTNDIICRVALGRKFDGYLKLPNLVKRLVDAFNVFDIGFFIRWLSWVDKMFGLIHKAEEVAKEVDEFLEEVIEEHVNAKKRDDANGKEVKDFLDILLDMQKEKDDASDCILDRDTVKTLVLEAFSAGTETTYASLEWTMSELIRNPRVMKKLQQEVTQMAQGKYMLYKEDLERMPYLRAVIKETLRLHPPFPLLPRISMQDVKLMGYDIAAGTNVIINAWAIARDPALWEDSNAFWPERFLENSISYQTLQFQWLPFGVGRRSCPGMQFSVQILELAVANIVYKFDMTLPNGKKNEDLDMNEEYGITIHKKSALLVSVSNRF